ncbi:hypothetical protein IC582_005658 [Cucumis melo]|uniref:Uncharacterized protein At2g39795, mitochondrial isoform X1 n=2 Tax=Cucumis melo TaxID=3656 RepID=A0A1S3C3N7_CUCME|nr:uncharacterized protein At2g39795, mitochondrial isoform X1 [Cucumis melo]
MLNKLMAATAVALRSGSRPSLMVTCRHSTSASSAVNSFLLRSLKEHYLEITRMPAPPKVSPPSSFSIITGALDGHGPVLTKNYGKEEVNISVMRLSNIVRGGGGDNDDDDINQLFLHVSVSKPEQKDTLHFLCGLYPDALGIHSVSMRPKGESSGSGFLLVPSSYNGPTFEDLDEKMRDMFHNYIEERGVNESLFPFLQAWLYVKEHRNLLRWFRSVGTFIYEPKNGKKD